MTNDNDMKQEDVSGYGLVGYLDFILPPGDTHRFRSLPVDLQRLFDQLYPDIARRERYNRMLLLPGAFFAGAGITMLGLRAGLSILFPVLALLDVFVSAVAIVIGGSMVVYSRIKEREVNELRESILAKPEFIPVFQAYTELTGDREHLLTELHNLKHTFIDLERSLKSAPKPGLKDLLLRGDKSHDLLNVVEKSALWVENASDLLSDDALNIVKDGLLKQRGSDELLVDKEPTLSDVLSDFFQNARHKIGGLLFSDKSSSPAGASPSRQHDSITQLDGFDRGWEKLTHLPLKDAITDAIDYDYLLEDYRMNKDKIANDIKVFQALASGLLSEDASVKKHILARVSSVSKTLNTEYENLSKLRAKARQAPVFDQDDLKKSGSYLVSVHRDRKTADIIESNFKLLEKATSEKRKIAEKQAALEKQRKDAWESKVSALNDKFSGDADKQ